MKLTRKLYLMLLTAAALAWNGSAQTADEQIQVARSAIKVDRKATVEKAMQFTEQEGQAFWPLYDKYRLEMDKVSDALLKLVKEYAQLYPDVPDKQAKVMLRDLGDLEERRVEIRNSYLGKMARVISPAKTLRFAQVESRLDLALRIGIAASVPLVPVEGMLTADAAGAAVVTEGVPGGNVVQTYELTATVTSIDAATRHVTLMDASGIKTTVKAGPEVRNFDQIQVGDQLRITATKELAVYVAGAGEASSDGAGQLVALTPEGAKPGGLMVETAQVTAKVIAIDAVRHEATLQFDDGSTRTVAVRPDVDLSKRQVGDQVVIRTTGTLAIRMVKP